MAKIRQAIEQGEECTVRLLNYTKTGKEFWNMFTLAPVRDDQGVVRFFAGCRWTSPARPGDGTRIRGGD